ncbi:TPA: hypothetical protein ACWL6U_000418 [Morganella morganii]
MELKYKLSDYYEPLSQTETTRMPHKQMEVLQFVDKINNVRLVIRHASANTRTMLAIPLAIILFLSAAFTFDYIYIDEWKSTEDRMLSRLEDNDKINNNIFILESHIRKERPEETYIKDGRLSFWDFLHYYYSYRNSSAVMVGLFAILSPLLFFIPFFYWGFIIRNRPPLICDREKQLFYTWDMKMNVYVARYSQIEFADIRPALALFLYRVDDEGTLVPYKYFPNLSLFSYLGTASDNDNAWGLGYITKYIFNGLAPLAESPYTRKRYRIFRDAPVPEDLEQQIQEQVCKVDAVLPPDEDTEVRLAESIKRSV